MFEGDPSICVLFVYNQANFAFGLHYWLRCISIFVAPFKYAEYHWAAIADVGQAKGALEHDVAVGTSNTNTIYWFPAEKVCAQHRAGQCFASQT